MSYPSDPELGWYYVVNVAGEVEGEYYKVGDWIVWNGTSWDKLAGRSEIDPIGIQKNYFGNGIKGDVITRDYEISVENGDDFDMKGWFVANGMGGTPNCIDKFVRSEAVSGVIAGSDEAVVVEHTHGIYSQDSGESRTAVTASIAPQASRIDGWLTEVAGVSGVGKNIPAKISAIPIIKMS